MSETGYPRIFWLNRGYWSKRNLAFLFIVIGLIIITFVLLRPVE